MNTQKQKVDNVKEVLQQLLTLYVNIPSNKKEKYIIFNLMTNIKSGIDIAIILNNLKFNIKNSNSVLTKNFYNKLLNIVLEGFQK
jgi:hypothetical protein